MVRKYPIAKETKKQGNTVITVKGSLLPYVGIGSDDNIEYVGNKVFEDTLTYVQTRRGRSSAVFIFEDSQGATYQMFMTDIDDLLKTKNISNGRVKAKWTFQKRGQNYGIRLAKEEENE